MRSGKPTRVRGELAAPGFRVVKRIANAGEVLRVASVDPGAWSIEYAQPSSVVLVGSMDTLHMTGAGHSLYVQSSHRERVPLSPLSDKEKEIRALIDLRNRADAAILSWAIGNMVRK